MPGRQRRRSRRYAASSRSRAPDYPGRQQAKWTCLKEQRARPGGVKQPGQRKNGYRLPCEAFLSAAAGLPPAVGAAAGAPGFPPAAAGAPGLAPATAGAPGLAPAAAPGAAAAPAAGAAPGTAAAPSAVAPSTGTPSTGTAVSTTASTISSTGCTHETTGWFLSPRKTTPGTALSS